MLYGCNGMVSEGSTNSKEAKPHCDVVIRYIVNYCLMHMNDTMALENHQVCWDRGMNSGLEYAVKYLDGGTGIMLKAQSDITATKDNAINALSRETQTYRPLYHQ